MIKPNMLELAQKADGQQQGRMERISFLKLDDPAEKSVAGTLRETQSERGKQANEAERQGESTNSKEVNFFVIIDCLIVEVIPNEASQDAFLSAQYV